MFTPLPDNFHALITGSSGAIGGAVAHQLRAGYPHARLTLVDFNPAPSEQLAGQLGGETHVLTADLSKLDNLPPLHERAVAQFGPVHLLVNCAGVMDVRSIETTPWHSAERTMVIDLLAPMRLVNLCVPAMVQAGGGAIVNISSMAGRVPLKGCGYYGAAKAGLAFTTEIARAELAVKNIRVIGVYPGAIHSELERGARSQYPEGMAARAMPSGQPQELARRILHAIVRNQGEVIYPDFYRIGTAFGGFGGLAQRIAVTYGPAARH